MPEEEQQQTESDDNQSENTITEQQVLGVVKGFTTWPGEMGEESEQLLEDIGDTTIEWTDPRVEEFLNRLGTSELAGFAAFVRTTREREQQEAADRAAEEAKNSDEGKRAEIKAALAKERQEAAEAARLERLTAEVLEEEARAAAGQQGPDPDAVTEFELTEIHSALFEPVLDKQGEPVIGRDGRPLTRPRPMSDGDREALHHKHEQLEEAREKGTTKVKEPVDFDPDEFLGRRK